MNKIEKMNDIEVFGYNLQDGRMSSGTQLKGVFDKVNQLCDAVNSMQQEVKVDTSKSCQQTARFWLYEAIKPCMFCKGYKGAHYKHCTMLTGESPSKCDIKEEWPNQKERNYLRTKWNNCAMHLDTESYDDDKIFDFWIEEMKTGIKIRHTRKNY